MKKYISYILLIPVLLLGSACGQKENEQQKQPVATMTGTYYVVADQAGEVLELSTGKATTVLVRAAAEEGKVCDLTLNFTFKADPDAVAAYNSAHGTSYVMSPGAAYEFTTAEAMMPKYGRSSTSAKLKLSASSLEDGITYILPLTIDKVTGTDKWELEEAPQAFILFKKAYVAPNAGSGTPEDPYNLYTAADLKAMNNQLVAKKMTYFRLQDDIDMTGIDWIPLNFESPYELLIDFDGNGHTISNLHCDYASYPSFFGVLYGNCHDVTFTNADISCDANSGCGILGGYGGTGALHCEVYRVHVHGKVTLNGNKTGVGGMFGCLANGNITASSADVDVYSTKNYVGGLVGYCKNTTDGNHISNCWVAGSVRGDQRVGGIAGGINGDGDEIVNCYSTTKLYIILEDGTKEYAATRSVGGIVAHANQDKGDANDTRTPGNVVQGCIAWQDDLKTRTYLGAGLDGNDFYSSGAIVAYGATHNTYADCYRRPELDFRDYSDLFLLYDQNNSSPSSPLVVKPVEGNTHNFPYHGKAAAPGMSITQLAKKLGWDSKVWDFSGDVPVLKGKASEDEPESPDPGGQLPDFDENEFYN